jgi:decaprenyl-phosphate phosphoribosyltransferase
MLALLQTARPKQWVKNLFVVAPLVFAKHLDDLPLALRAAAAFAIFCALSSAVYLWNDIVDVEKDRAHPTKKNRPIPSGRLSIQAASIAAGALAVSALALATLLRPGFALAAAGYLLLNLAYSLILKHIVYLDVLSIAAGFLLRVIGGALAVDVWTSPYLLVCTGLLACFLGFGKRAHELAQGGAKASSQRAVLRSYRADVLKWALYLTGAATFAAYALYTRAEHTVSFFGTTRMIFTAPCAAFGLVRFQWLVRHSERGDSPTDAMLKDIPFMINILAYGVAVTLIIYFRG